MEKRDLSERDICTKLITPAILQAGWKQEQFREEVKLTPGRVIVRGKVAQRVKDPEAKGGPKRSDYVLYAKPNIALATLEAKRSVFPVGHGMQQSLVYAEMLDAPFAISSNGNGFLFHDRTGITSPTERELTLDAFPTYDEMWTIYQQWKGMTSPDAHQLMAQPYYTDGTGKEPYYYQKVAINRAMEHIAKGDKRMLLVMATGTGKTYTAFQIIWRLWKAKRMKRILFLADRNILVDQTILQDFAPFGEVMHKIVNREAKKNYEIYMALYQAITGTEDVKQIFREFPADFFDLIVVDECHRGSADEDSAFDGDPVTIYEPGVDDPIVPPDDLDSGSDNDESEPDDDFEGGGDNGPGPVSEPRLKYVLDNVNVRPGVERIQYLDADGQLKTESYQVFIKEQIKRSLLERFTSLEDFLSRWTKAERKQVIVDELNEIGIDFEVLQNAVPNADQFDVFDLVSHIAWDAKPLTRRERAANVKKRNYFDRYGEQARAVLEALLDKYADHGIADIEDAAILELPPFDEFGTKMQIRRDIFGGTEAFSRALTELEAALYSAQAA